MFFSLIATAALTQESSPQPVKPIDLQPLSARVDNIPNPSPNLLPSTESAQPTPIAQAPEIDPEAGAPRLRPEPATPEEAPFRPQRVPLQQVSEVSPSITFLTPSAYGKSWGNASVGIGFQARNRFSDRADAVLGVGVGFGDPEKIVGLDVGVTSVSTLRRTPFTAGTVSLKVHRRIAQDLAVAVGVQNLIRWGTNDSVTSPYGVVTKRFRLQENTETPLSQVYVSAGLGSGTFESDVDDRLDSVGAFGSVALRVIRPVNVIAEWSGQELTLGASWTPFPEIPLVIAPGVTDITGNAGDGARFILGVGYGINF